jgi:hypothetical protein
MIEDALHMWFSREVGKSRFQAARLAPHEKMPGITTIVSPILETAGKLSSGLLVIGLCGRLRIMKIRNNIFRQ